MSLNFDDLLGQLVDTPLAHWADPLQKQLHHKIHHHNNGNVPKFLASLEQLPSALPSHLQLEQDAIEVGQSADLSPESHDRLLAGLTSLMPWRKGPFRLFGHYLDSEWQCQLKWQRVEPHLASLKGRTVLDVGSGNGYYGWRILGKGAQRVVGIDPSWLSVIQHQAINKYIQHPRHHVLPLTLEELTPELEAFDTVFSMGVLYHRRSPLDHLESLRQALRPGGELVLETLVVPGGEGYALVPKARYARMNNVWFLPTSTTLMTWCEKMGFDDVRCVDEAQTTVEEQRTTAWKPGQSLADYLEPSDHSKTIEGHPAPRRAVIVATRPESGRLRRYHLKG